MKIVSLLLAASLAASFVTACTPDSELVKDKAAFNNAPVANAGINISQTSDTPITLDGSGSFDPDGDAITLSWAFDTVPTGSALSGTEASLPGNNTSAPHTTFLADKAGTYVLSLIVEDALGATSSVDFVIVTVEDGKEPVANAGTDLTGIEGETFSLSGADSYDPLGRTLTYKWKMESAPSGSTVSSLSGDTTSSSSFVADKGGVYVVSLIVDNGLDSSSPDTALVRVSTADPLPPIALAGDDVTTEDCSWATLTGAGSYDPNGDSLTYQWVLQSKPSNSTASDANFDDTHVASPKFYPDVAGAYQVSLAVYDGTAWSTPDTLKITADERVANALPSVEAGTPKAAAGGDAECSPSGYTYDCDSCAPVTLALGDDATATDPDGDALTYLWTVVSGNGVIDDPTSLSTTVSLEDAEPTEPTVCEENEFQFLLTVTDCTGATASDTVTYTVTCCGIAASAMH